MTHVRSWLFTAAKKGERFQKAFASGADIVILDLEDSVARALKDDARRQVFSFVDSSANNARLAIRINALVNRFGLLDLLAASEAELAWIILPKAESPTQVEQIRKLCPKSRIAALIESARGISTAFEIARGGADALIFGAADYSSEMGLDCVWKTLLFARARIVEAAVLAGVPVIDTPFFSIAEPDALSSEARAARSHGFSGKAAIHPAQIDAINAAFSPSEEDLRWARAT